MSVFKFGFTSDKDNKEEKQTKGRVETKQKYEKESKNAVFFPNGKMLLNGLRQHIKRDQHLPVFFFLCYLVPTTYKFIVNILFKTSQ